MDKLERLYALHRLFGSRRSAIALSEIAERLECSPATAKRCIREFRTVLNAPLEYDAPRGGYRYLQPEGAPRFELPGLWWNADELAALVTFRDVLSGMEPGLLRDVLAPLSRRLDDVLAHRRVGLREAGRRIRVLSQHARSPGNAFTDVARAVLDRRILRFSYQARSDGRTSRRTVSPQRLTRYRGCWYLDALCHDARGLRSFALERISDARDGGERADDVPDAELDAHYGAAYGVFAGAATRTAVLRVTPHRARWVADERWHPDQDGRFLDDGSYELRVPYGVPEELVGDILRLGPEVEVVEPEVLRNEVAERLRIAASRYESESPAKTRDSLDTGSGIEPPTR